MGNLIKKKGFLKGPTLLGGTFFSHKEGSWAHTADNGRPIFNGPKRFGFLKFS